MSYLLRSGFWGDRGKGRIYKGCEILYCGFLFSLILFFFLVIVFEDCFNGFVGVIYFFLLLLLI